MKKMTLIFLCFVILRANGQGSWHLIPNVPAANFDVFSISVVNAQTVWAVADTFTALSSSLVGTVPQVLRTTDGGATWQTHRVYIAADRLAWDIHGLDELTAIFTSNQFNLTENKPIFKTSDGGLTWKKIVPPNNTGGVFIHFFNSKEGIVINRNKASTTTDGGETWSLVPASNFPTFATDEYNLLYTTGNFVGHFGDRLWYGTSKGRIMSSLDRGNHWQAVQVAGPDENIQSIAFSDSLHGIALATGNINYNYPISLIYATSDGGDTWTLEKSAPLGDAQVVTAVPEAKNVFFFGTIVESNDSPSFIARTNNIHDPLAWSQLPPDSVYINSFDFHSPTVGFASGASRKLEDRVNIGNLLFRRKYFYKWVGTVLSSDEVLNKKTSKISPNPAHDFLKIDFENPNNGKALMLTITSTTGQIIFSKETSDNKLDISMLSPGMYIVKIESDQDQVVEKFLKY